MDERKKRCQMEVSLYSQAIELLDQHQMFVPTHYAPLPCSITTQESEIWFALQEESPSLPLSSTWVTTDVQEAFYNAFQEELNMQAELMTMSLTTRHNNTYLCNLGLDLLILQSKMCRAEAEIELYNVAIENAHGFNLCGSSRPLCKAAHCYNEDKEVDDGSEGYEDYEDWKL
ncbi:hypothetical protein BDR06DRAFT_973931 [Suillus hirtellus]|nr:hypothetical protein BDR06DRAFT_973931 [Suillus hirtellus]